MNDNHQAENELLNALNHTMPDAEKAFQDNLEEQLMAGLQNSSINQNTEDNIMPLFGAKQKRNQHSSRLPLTLAAAVLAIVIAGGLLFFVQGSSDLALQEAVCDYSGQIESYQVQDGDTLSGISEQFGISVETLANANCIDDSLTILFVGQVITIPILPDVEPIEDTREFHDDYSLLVIARQDIPLNTRITEDMLITVLVPDDFMNELQPPLSSFMNVISSPELAIGQQATTLIRQYEPVLTENLSTACPNTSCINISQGYIIFNLVTGDQTPLSITPGQHIDILAPLQYVTRFNGEKQVVTEANLPLDVVPELRLETIISDAILVEAQPTGDIVIVTLAVKAPDFVMLERIGDLEHNMRFVPHVPPGELANAIIQIRGLGGISNIDAESILITNTGQLIDMSGWSLEDEDGNSFVFEELILFRDAEHQIFTGEGLNTPVRSYMGLNEAIYESGETVRLYDADGVLHTEYQIP